VERQNFPASRSARLELLAAGLEELGRDPDRDLLDALERLAQLVADWSPRVNLTAHRDPEAVIRHLVLDALALGTVLPAAASLVDLGSGAGFPGFPLALLDLSRPVTLVESRERAYHFQRAVIRELGLVHVRARRGRVEELTPEPHGGVVAQAMGPPRDVVALMRAWASPGGWLAIPYSTQPPSLEPPPGVHEEPALFYQVPCGGPGRSVWLGRVV
jgi:16S rRNA (guanine527-N7)-methyltransferase